MNVVINTNGNKVELPDYVLTCSINGNEGQIGRTCEVEIIFSEEFNYNPSMENTIVQIFEENVELFRGYIMDKDIDTSASTLKMQLKDNLVYTVKNDTIGNVTVKEENTIDKVFKDTPENICKYICNNFNITYDTFSYTGNSITYIANGKTISDVMIDVYKEAGKKNGKKYYLLSELGKINMLEKGSYKCGVTIDENMIDKITFAETIDNMVNRVVVFDDTYNVVATKENSDDIKKYGLFQKIIIANDDDVPSDIAKNNLKPKERLVNLTIPGNVYLKTGRTVNVNFPFYGIKGDLYIKEDTHNFNDGMYTCSLTLSYEIGDE